MDTLCISMGEDYSEWKAMAINDMVKLYVQATSMLVLDENLETNFPDDCAVDLQADSQILCSPWMSRAWTMQEAALGLNRYVRVKRDRFILASLLKTVEDPAFDSYEVMCYMIEQEL